MVVSFRYVIFWCRYFFLPGRFDSISIVLRSFCGSAFATSIFMISPSLYLLFVVRLLSGCDVNMVCISKYDFTQHDIPTMPFNEPRTQNDATYTLHHLFICYLSVWKLCTMRVDEGYGGGNNKIRPIAKISLKKAFAQRRRMYSIYIPEMNKPHTHCASVFFAVRDGFMHSWPINLVGLMAMQQRTSCGSVHTAQYVLFIIYSPATIDGLLISVATSRD